MAKRGSEGPSGLQSGAISRRLVGDGAISMLYNTKNSLMQCWRRPVTRITTLAPARAFSVNGLQDLDFLTASQGAFRRALRILLARARGRAFLLPFAAGSRRLARGAGTALHLGRRLGNRDLAGGGGLSGHERLPLVDLLVLGGDDLFGLRRRSRRMELRAEEHDEAAFFVDLIAHQPLVLDRKR